eukprot:4341611-Lingulodinium_polyedra.AAC.1
MPSRPPPEPPGARPRWPRVVLERACVHDARLHCLIMLRRAGRWRARGAFGFSAIIDAPVM